MGILVGILRGFAGAKVENSKNKLGNCKESKNGGKINGCPIRNIIRN
jgi:hypothetical protein